MTTGEIIGIGIAGVTMVGSAFGFIWLKISDYAIMKEKISTLEKNHNEYNTDLKTIHKAINDSRDTVLKQIDDNRKEFREDIKEIREFINKI